MSRSETKFGVAGKVRDEIPVIVENITQEARYVPRGVGWELSEVYNEENNVPSSVGIPPSATISSCIFLNANPTGAMYGILS